VDFEGQPYRSSGSINKGDVPTAAEISGIFPATDPIYNPQTGEQFPGNTIPNINPVAARIAAAIPASNLSGNSSFNYFNTQPNNTDDNRFGIRIDQQFGSKDSFFARYQFQHQKQPQHGLFAGTLLTGDDNITANSDGVVASEVHTFSANLVNEARFGWTRLDWKGVPVNAGKDINTQVGIPGIPIQDGITGGLAGINFNNNLSGYGGANVEEDLNGVYQGSDTLSWTHGRHTMKFGFDYRHISFLSEASSFAPNGGFSFDGHYTAGVSSSGVATSGDPFADFLLNLPAQSQLSAIHTNDYQRRAYSGFAEDHFQVSPKLSLDIGIRYDFITPVWDAHNHGAILDPYSHVFYIPGYTGVYPDAVQNQINFGIITINNKANRYFGVQPDYHDFSPRLGFAYLITPKTVFRAGYGLYYGPEQLGPFGQPSAGFSVPFLQEATYTPASPAPTSINPVTLSNGFPSSALTNPTTPTFFGAALNLRTPYFGQYNATLQRELTPSSSLDISYIGSKTTSLYVTQDWNIPSAATNDNVSIAARQGFPSVDANGNLSPGGAIQGPSNQGMGNYNALGIKLDKRFSKGLTLLSAYTWSHNIDDITNSGLSTGNNGRASFPADQLKGQRGNSDWNIADRWITAFRYELPFGRGQLLGSGVNRLTNAVIGGWEVGGILDVESGPWYTVNQNADSAHNGGTAYCGTCRQRPDAVPRSEREQGSP
jgi:hypothetical protein